MEFELLGAEVRSDIKYGSNYNQLLRRVIDELASNLNDTEGLEYQLSDSE